MKKILITGYSGFVGKALVEALQRCALPLLLLGRRAHAEHVFYQSDLLSPFDLREVLSQVDVVIHCAARAHIMKESTIDPLAHYRRMNVDVTERLAKQAAAAGVKRFIFLSSIKVNGESTRDGQAFSETVQTIPEDPYGLSKYEAEQALQSICAQSAMSFVVIRPTLVYGTGVKGNFLSMIRLVQKGFPLPLACIKSNKRSLLALDNLINFIVCCVDVSQTPQADNQVFVLSDGEGISTADLLHAIAKAYVKPARLLPFPLSILKILFNILGKRAMGQRLLGDLEVNSTKARSLLNWKPVTTMEQQLAKMADEHQVT